MAGPEQPEHGRPNGHERRRRTVRRGVVIAAVVSVVIVAFVSVGLYRYGFLPFDEDREYNHLYVLRIETDSDDEYTLVCPIPLNRTGAHYAAFLDEIEMTLGDLDVSLVDTLHGKALEARGVGDATLEWHGSWDEEDGDWYLDLSMTSGDAFDFENNSRESWIYADRGNLSIRLSFFAEQTYNASPTFMSGGGPGYILMGNDEYYTLRTQTGWQETVFEFYWSAIN